MGIDQLVQLMPPPEKSLAASGDWQAVAAAVGTALPIDYMAFISRYGTGRVSGFLWVYNPFEQNAHLNLVSRLGIILQPEETVTSALQTYLNLKRAAGRSEDAANAVFQKYLSHDLHAAAVREEKRKRGDV